MQIIKYEIDACKTKLWKCGQLNPSLEKIRVQLNDMPTHQRGPR